MGKRCVPVSVTELVTLFSNVLDTQCNVVVCCLTLNRTVFVRQENVAKRTELNYCEYRIGMFFATTSTSNGYTVRSVPPKILMCWYCLFHVLIFHCPRRVFLREKSTSAYRSWFAMRAPSMTHDKRLGGRRRGFISAVNGFSKLVLRNNLWPSQKQTVSQ